MGAAAADAGGRGGGGGRQQRQRKSVGPLSGRCRRRSPRAPAAAAPRMCRAAAAVRARRCGRPRGLAYAWGPGLFGPQVRGRAVGCRLASSARGLTHPCTRLARLGRGQGRRRRAFGGGPCAHSPQITPASGGRVAPKRRGRARQAPYSFRGPPTPRVTAPAPALLFLARPPRHVPAAAVHQRCAPFHSSCGPCMLLWLRVWLH